MSQPPNPLYISRYIYRGVVRIFGTFHPTPVSPLLGQSWDKVGTLGQGEFLTVSLTAAGVFSAGISQTMPRYENANLPDNGSVRESYTGLTASIVGFFIGEPDMTKSMQPSPRPWRIERREIAPTKTCHHRRTQYFLVDRDGREVWRTEANMRYICDCVNRADNP